MDETEEITCSYCGSVFDAGDATYVGDDALCPECAEAHTVNCERCGATIYVEDNSGSEEYPLCSDCFSNFYQRCSRCGTLIANSDACYLDDDDDSALCYSCYLEAQEEEQCIHNYNFKPEPIFYGTGKRFFGIELEIDEAGKSEANARELLRIANAGGKEHLYIKTDSSLNDGLELVSHPMALNYHLNEMPWADILEAAIGMGYLSHRT